MNTEKRRHGDKRAGVGRRPSAGDRGRVESRTHKGDRSRMLVSRGSTRPLPRKARTHPALRFSGPPCESVASEISVPSKLRSETRSLASVSPRLAAQAAQELSDHFRASGN